MARAGHKYPLLVYQHMLNRWWPAMITMGLVMFVFAYIEYTDPIAQFIAWRWQLAGAVGVLAIIVGLTFIVIKNFAYVQPLPNYLKLVTPFMRVNISYKRIKRTIPTEIRYLFPPKSLSGWMQDILAPLSNKTALVIELSGYPISPTILRMFLSRFFFKDKTPHLIILVKDWMQLSAELDSMRTDTGPRPPEQRKRTRDSILSRLPGK
ncbi:MAG TPA: hypothetical protein VF896_18370 [Anaerolineales bacterium]